ncbi:hypothetical protein KUCAC02_017951, partial [Chaenocephalus aceratus]
LVGNEVLNLRCVGLSISVGVDPQKSHEVKKYGSFMSTMYVVKETAMQVSCCWKQMMLRAFVLDADCCMDMSSP